MRLKDFRITTRSVKLERPIGDSQVCYDTFTLELLELMTDNGVGVFGHRPGLVLGLRPERVIPGGAAELISQELGVRSFR